MQKEEKTLNLRAKTPFWDILKLKFEKLLFEISTCEFVQIQNFVQNKKISNFGPNMPYLGIF